MLHYPDLTSQKYAARMIPTLFDVLEFRLKDQIWLGVAVIYRILKFYILPQQKRIQDAIREKSRKARSQAAGVQ